MTLPVWWPRLVITKLAGRRVLFSRARRAVAPDIFMILHWFPDGPAIVRLGRRWGIPVVANIIGSKAELLDGGRRIALSRLPKTIKAALQRYQRDRLNQVSVVTVTGEMTGHWLRTAGISRPIMTMHAAIPVPPADGLRAGRDIDIVFIGRADADKRADRLFRVLRSVGSARPGTTATVVGLSGEAVAGLTDYRAVQDLLGEGLRILQWVDDVGDVLRRAKVLVVTSDTEGRTLAVLEALACEAAVVATAVGDLPEALLGGRAGIAVPLEAEEEGVVEGLAGAILKLLRDEPLRQRLAATGRAMVEQVHSFEHAQADWQRVLGFCELPGPTKSSILTPT